MLNTVIDVVPYVNEGFAIFYDNEGSFVMTEESDEIQEVSVYPLKPNPERGFKKTLTEQIPMQMKVKYSGIPAILLSAG